MSPYFYEDNDGQAGLVLAWSPDNVRHVKQADKHARQMIAAAVELDGVRKHRPLVFAGYGDQGEADEWWTTVFGDTEAELEQQASELARSYRQLRWRPWRWLERRRIKHRYIRVDEILTVGNGLTTEWR